MSPEVLGPIRDVFSDRGRTMVENSGHPRVVTTETVYQEANRENRNIIDTMLDEIVLPGSEIVGIDRLVNLGDRSRAGEPCLILMEHYSNFDIPALYYLLSHGGYRETADSIVAIAGMKLNEDSGFVRAFTEAYTRVVIYPSRTLESISDPAVLADEMRRSKELNMAATRQMIRFKHHGKMILVFPSGTRYRPGRPDTKRGVKEVDSYIKSFGTMVFVGIAGNVLRIHPTGDMSRDLVARDVMVFDVSEPVSCHDFRRAVRNSAPEQADLKQHVADAVMARLETHHADAQRLRQQRIGGLS